MGHTAIQGFQEAHPANNSKPLKSARYGYERARMLSNKNQPFGVVQFCYPFFAHTPSVYRPVKDTTFQLSFFHSFSKMEELKIMEKNPKAIFYS